MPPFIANGFKSEKPIDNLPEINSMREDLQNNVTDIGNINNDSSSNCDASIFDEGGETLDS